MIVAPPMQSIRWWEILVTFCFLFWVHVSLMYACLWLIKQIVSDEQPIDGRNRRWQLSIQQLLVITTIVAVCLALIANTGMINSSNALTIGIWITNNIGIGIAAVLLVRRHRGFATRIALFGLAVAVLALFQFLVSYRARFDAEVVAVNVVQAIILLLWLELTPILPPFEPSAAAATEQSPTAC
jgi:hypothetical protein